MINPGRYNKIDYTGLLGSFIASWILHCILFAIAATTTIYYPPTAERELISIDLLLAAPGFTPPQIPLQETSPDTIPVSPAKTSIADEAVKEPPSPPSETATDKSDLDLMTMAVPQHEKKKAPPLKSLPPLPVRPRIVKESRPPPPTPVIIPAEADKTPEQKPDEAFRPPVETPATPPVELQTKSMEQLAQEKLAIENEKIRRQQEVEQRAAKERALEEARAAEIDRTAQLEKQEAEKAARLRLAAERERIRRMKEVEQKALDEARAARIARAAELEKQSAEKARREQLARLKNEEEKAAREKLALERAAAEKIAKERQEQTRLAAAARKNESSLPGKAVSSTTPAAPVMATVAAAVKPLPAVVPTITDKNQLPKQQELKGLALPPVKGDIKLIMTAEEDLIVKVLFVSYPKARHDRPITKKEAKEQQKLTPVVVRTAKNSLEAVLEQSREGVYIFLVEQKGSKPVNGKFSLKLFETKIKSVTGREISGQTEVARLLMPEGILWEDESAFSGNIEDSDSVTKFNSESGLVWKEYRR